MTEPETWVSISDTGVRRVMTVTYDDNGLTAVHRDDMHDLMTRAGLRLSLDTPEDT